MNDEEYEQQLNSKEQLIISNIKRDDDFDISQIKKSSILTDDFEDFLNKQVLVKPNKKIYEPQSKIIGSKIRLDSFMNISMKAADRMRDMISKAV